MESPVGLTFTSSTSISSMVAGPGSTASCCKNNGSSYSRGTALPQSCVCRQDVYSRQQSSEHRLRDEMPTGCRGLSQPSCTGKGILRAGLLCTPGKAEDEGPGLQDQ